MPRLTLLTLLPFLVGAEPRVVAYYAEWSVYARKFNVADIPTAGLTHINYAFAKIEGGEVRLHDPYAAIDKFHPGDKWDAGYLRGNFRQLQHLKKKHPHLKTLIAVGGWTLSSPFSDAALTAESRGRLAKSAVAFMAKYGFDGIDLDWEYPVSGGLAGNKTRPADRENYTLLCAALRAELDSLGKKDGRKYLLTAAAPAGPKVVANFELKKLAAHLDWFNLMAYDFHGGWSPLTHFNAALHPIKDDPAEDEAVRTGFNVAAAVKAYLDAGVPADKVVLGLPLYGRGWHGVKEGDGLFQKPAMGLPRGTWEPGVFDYKDIAANRLPKMKRHWHAEAKVPWLHDAKSGLMITYDDAESIKVKGEYAREKKLGGVMMWEVSADDGKGTLLGAARAGLGLKK